MLVGTYNPSLVLVSLGVAVLASYTALGMANRVRAANACRRRGTGCRAARSRWASGSGPCISSACWPSACPSTWATTFPDPAVPGHRHRLLGIRLVDGVPRRTVAAPPGGRRPAHGRGHRGDALRGHGRDAHAARHRLSQRLVRAVHPDRRGRVGRGAVDHLPAAPRRAAHGVSTAAGVGGDGLAIVGMHYTGMQAAGFPDDSVCLASNGGLSAGWLAIAVTAVTLSVLGIALIVAVLDNRLEARTSAWRRRWPKPTKNWCSWPCTTRSPSCPTAFCSKTAWSRPSKAPAGARAISRCCSSTWTVSRRSTTPTATIPATRCSSTWRNASARLCAPRTPLRDWAATNSSS